jgi:hypothetical protein
MNGIDPGFDHRFTALEAPGTRPEGVPELALDHRVERLDLPTLPLNPIPAGRRHPVRPRFRLRVGQLTVGSDRPNAVQAACAAGIETRSAQKPAVTPPLAPATLTRRLPLERLQKANLGPTTGTPRPSQPQPRVNPKRRRAFDPVSELRPGSGWVGGTGLRQAQAGAVGRDPLRFDCPLPQPLILQRCPVAQAQLLEAARPGAGVRHPRPFQRCADRIGCQQPVFQVPVAHLPVNPAPHARDPRRLPEALRTFRMRVAPDPSACQRVSDPRGFHLATFVRCVWVHAL